MGLPDAPAIRSTVWKLLLGYLPSDRAMWPSELANKRSQYNHFKDDLLMSPVLAEKAYLVGVEQKGIKVDSFGIEESLKELAQLADTAGLQVVGFTYQKLAAPNPRTYIGSGKVSEIKSAIHAFDVETVIFDDELSPGSSCASDLHISILCHHSLLALMTSPKLEF
ncbi:uncharacterized protein LOC110706162 isoform X1 [Chenopodium quinoa]|uniref:uncharacterized protein LOC110706162 isoform X1 n=1 Tax=Chenopodium quinoa TaxID=63459 RepID=UPI000B791EC7|nr:uncharacterized protein LOC110706162 isoform X1 [Chenopodium quinoa]